MRRFKLMRWKSSDSNTTISETTEDVYRPPAYIPPNERTPNPPNLLADTSRQQHLPSVLPDPIPVAQPSPPPLEPVSRPPPLPVRLTQNVAQTAAFCSRCQAIDFDAISDCDAFPPTGKHILWLDSATTAPQRTCPLCAILHSFLPAAHASNPGGAQERYELRAHDSMRLFNIQRARRSDANVLLAVTPQSRPAIDRLLEDRVMILTRARDAGDRRAPREATHSKFPELFQHRGIDPVNIDYELMTGWIDHCSKVHTTCMPQAAHSSITGFQVIDCGWEQIVPVRSDLEYYTLSYVWGAPGPDDHLSFEELVALGKIPQTISDMMTVVKRLGGRYLWVDRYCIPKAHKNAQIRRMDKIYEYSLATLVVASGTGADSGIPGVSIPREARKRSAVLKGHELTTTMPHISYFLGHSVWATRGWTYQEAMIPPRCLFFTDGQVYFSCRSGSQSEALALTPRLLKLQDEATAGSPAMQSPLMSRTLPSFNNRGDLEAAFYQQLGEYTKRSLTFESDALDAFRGILARSPFPSYWGIPMLVDPKDDWRVGGNGVKTNTGLARGLMWTAESAEPAGARAKSSFPTWSWTSARKKASYTLCHISRHLRSRSEFFAEDIDGTLTSLPTLASRLGFTTNVVSEFSRSLHITGLAMRVRLKTSSRAEGKYQVENKKYWVTGRAWVDASAEEELGDRLAHELWDAVELGRNVGGTHEYGGQSYWMLLDEDGEEYYRRIGIVVGDHGTGFDEREQEIRTFRVS